MMYGAKIVTISSTCDSEWIFKSIGLERSKLKIPIMDFASITYLPDTRSKSTSNFAKSFTKDLTLSMEFNEIRTVFRKKTSSCCALFQHYMLVKIITLYYKVMGEKSRERLYEI